MNLEQFTTKNSIKTFVEENPRHPFSAAWGDMLSDEELGGEGYTIQDYIQEAEYIVFDHGITMEDLK